jgi:hypothetical protein
MTADPARRGGALAAFHLAVVPRLFDQLVETGFLPAATLAPPQRTAWREWSCLALHASVRGLVAAAGFGPDTAATVDAFHAEVLAAWREDAADEDAFAAWTALAARRHGEYGTLARAAGDADEAAARAAAEALAVRLAGGAPAADLVASLAALTEALTAGAAEAVRVTEDVRP